MVLTLVPCRLIINIIIIILIVIIISSIVIIIIISINIVLLIQLRPSPRQTSLGRENESRSLVTANVTNQATTSTTARRIAYSVLPSARSRALPFAAADRLTDSPVKTSAPPGGRNDDYSPNGLSIDATYEILTDDRVQASQ